MGDRYTPICVLDESDQILEESRVATSQRAFRQRFFSMPPVRLVLEAGSRSQWAHRSTLSSVLAEQRGSRANCMLGPLSWDANIRSTLMRRMGMMALSQAEALQPGPLCVQSPSGRAAKSERRKIRNGYDGKAV